MIKKGRGSALTAEILSFERGFEAMSCEFSPAWRSIQSEARAALAEPLLKDTGG